MPVTSLVPPGRPCLDALVRALAEGRGGDPLAPATVLVPAAVPALHVRRALGRLGGVAAVEVITVARLADRLARPALEAAGTVPLPPGGWEEAVRVALAADPGPFRAVAHHPATVARVGAALRRLQAASPGDGPLRSAPTSAPGPLGGPARHLLRLLAAVEAGTPGHHHRAQVVAAACAALSAGTDPGPVVAFCPPGLDLLEGEVLSALAATGRLRVVAAVTGDPAADEPGRRLGLRLGGAGPETVPATAPPLPTHLVLAPDAEAEARLVVQQVVAALEAGLAGHDIAVVAFGGIAGLGRLADLLDAAGVPWSGPAGRSLAATPSGRAVLGLLRLGTEGWTHAGVLAALAAAPLRRGPTRPAPLPLGRWAALARAANVVAGPDQWQDRPAAAAARARRHVDESLAAELDDLAAFATELRALLGPPEAPTWTSLAQWAVGVLDHVLDPSGGAHPCSDAEAAAHEAVRAVVAGLRALDDVVVGGDQAPPTPDHLVAALDALLGTTAAPRHGRVGHGVLVATDPVDLLGSTPGLLLLAGVVEGAAPARRAPDPLLSDADLQVLGVASRALRPAASRAAVLHAVAAAGRSVAFAHRADAQSARRPSRWFLGWAGALAGAAAPLGADDLERAAGPWLTVVPSFAATVCGAVAGSVQERRLADLAVATAAGTPPSALGTLPLVRAHAALDRAVTAALARRSGRFTVWDGLLAPGLALDTETSASALEDYATCPQRYLLRHVLRVAATDPPGDALAVDGGDRGSLAHQVLAAVVRRGLGRPPTVPWDEDDRAFLAAELRRRADALREQGRLGRGVLAELRIDELQASLLAALDLDDATRAEEGWVPDDVEQGFGEGHGRPVAVTLPSGRTVRFRGRIDRIDRSDRSDRSDPMDGGDGGRVRVVDYKTGRGKRFLEAAAGGAAAARLLQLGVYEAAAAAARPAAEVSSGWWLLEALGRDGRPVPIQPNHLLPEAFSAALDAVAAGIEDGAFPADPGEDGYRGPDSCRHCDYDRVCRVDRVRSLQRKAGDPALAAWRALHEVGDAVAADDHEAGG